MTKGVLTRDTERTNRLPHWFDDAPEKLTDDDVVDRFKFNLLELSWEMDVQSDSTKINQFLRKQSNLEVFKGELKSSSIGCLMRELPNLTQVQLDVFETYLVGDRVHKRHFNERGFYLPLRNENWQNINIRELISVRRADMFKFCPNVEIAGVCVGELIILQSAWDEKLCPRLRKILIHDYHRSTRGISADISFPFIKDVEFSTYCSNEMMIEYISQNKHIETLTFNRKYGDKLEKAELTFILKTCKNLKHLIAPYQIDFYEDWSDFAEIINEFGENLEYMKLRNIQVVLDVIKKIRSQKLKFDLLSYTPCNMSREFIK